MQSNDFKKWTQIHHTEPLKQWFRDMEAAKIVLEREGGRRVYQLEANLYGIYLKGPVDMPDVWSYLIVGEEKAMLIDTGYGVDNLKSVVLQLAGNKPLIVVNTHSHKDHMMGNYQFEEVWIHEREVPYLLDSMNQEYVDHAIPEEAWGEKTGKRISYHPYLVRKCQNHHTFSLGKGHEVELIEVPGHSTGSSVFLDKKYRTLFTGDAVMLFTCSIGRKGKYYPEYADLRYCANALAELAEREQEYVRIYPGHGKTGISTKLVKETLSACHKMIEKPDCNEFTEKRFGMVGQVKVCGDAAILVYPI